MAHYKRRRPRTSGTHHARPRGHWLRHWPRWWDILFHNRPRRTKTHRLERMVLKGRVDPDDVAWPLGNRRPHNYYW